MGRFALAIQFLLLSSNLPCLGIVEGYLPLTKTHLAKRFRTRTIEISQGEPQRLTKAKFQTLWDEDGNLKMQGRDRKGKPWVVHSTFFFIRLAAVADLDKDGQEDVLFLVDTGGNGMAPFSRLLTVQFDAQGRPIANDIALYFTNDNRGIQDLLDLNQDGRAELLCQDFNNGYWITSLYEAREGHWRRVNGPHAGLTFPLFNRFTSKPNLRATTPRRIRGFYPIESDLSSEPQPHVHPWPGRKSLLNIQSIIIDSPQGRDVFTGFELDSTLYQLALRQDAQFRVSGQKLHRYFTSPASPTEAATILWVTLPTK